MKRRLRDPNLARAQAAPKTRELRWHDAFRAPCVLEGFRFRRRGEPLRRLPAAIMRQVPPLLEHVSVQPGGAGVRLTAPGDRLAVRVELGRNETSPYCTLTSTHGIDAYVDSPEGWLFVGSLVPANAMRRWTAEVTLGPALTRRLPSGPRHWLLMLPLQNPVTALAVGAVGRAVASRPRRVRKPLGCYGSSITQGFCASRPGCAWTTRVAAALDAELVPLGFGGSARGELVVAEAIASLDLSCLVIDYDSNAPTCEHLEATHLPFVRAIRARRPRLPLVIASSPNYHVDDVHYRPRRAIIRATVDALRATGDRRVWFVDGASYSDRARWPDATVDRLHPNDQGFDLMAQRLLPVIRRAIARGP